MGDAGQALIEQWLPVSGKDLYEVSSLGRVRSWNNNGWGRRAEPALLKLQKDAEGYFSVCLGRGRRRRVHLLVLEAFVGARPVGMEAAHSNGDSCDNRASNLRWSTPVDNAADRDVHGTTVRGEHSPMARLSEQDVRSIRAMRAAGARNVDVAAAFGISPQSCSGIVHRKKWKHIGPEA